MQQEFSQRTLPMPSAPPLDQAQPEGNFVRDALYLAVRQAQIGQPANARRQIKTAIFQLNQIGDPVQKAYWQGQVDLTTAYVESKAGEAEPLRVAAQLSDAEYIRNQKLRPDAMAELVADNVDTQRALDAESRGENPTWAYNERKITALPAEVSGKVAGVVGGVLSPWKWAFAVGGLVLAVVVGGYAYYSLSTAKAVVS